MWQLRFELVFKLFLLQNIVDLFYTFILTGCCKSGFEFTSIKKKYFEDVINYKTKSKIEVDSFD